MAVVPTCPRCRGVLLGTGGRERCPRCGEYVVAFVRKLCTRCGTDISSTHRLRDSTGQYYCETCWLETCAQSGQTPLYPCCECGGWFASEHIYRLKYEYICTGCWELKTSETTRGDQAEAVLTALATAGESPEAAAGHAHAPSVYTSAVAARLAEREKKNRRLLIAAIVVGTVLFVLLMVWAVSR